MTTSDSSKRAKYLTSSSPAPEPPPSAKPDPGYSFCESVHATSYSPWHIRRLDSRGKKLGGGITTSSLCTLVTRGWDLEVEITEHHLDHACKRCKQLYLEQTSG